MRLRGIRGYFCVLMDQLLHISLLGELSVELDGQPIELPASRKARALLGYIAATLRPARREHLCELFWDLPDDPRGSLRWALSKLRTVVDDKAAPRIIADRERVSFSSAHAQIDLSEVRKRLIDDPPFLPPVDLRAMAEKLERPFLDGLEQAGSERFQFWLTSEREDIHLLRLNVLRRLALHPDVKRSECVKWARLWKELTPLEEEAARGLIQALALSGREAEARRCEDDFITAAREVGLVLSGSLMPGSATPAIPKPAPGRPVESIPRRGLRKQRIGFCRASDGARIAYATMGEGRPLVKAANWLNHLELDWGSPVWGPTFDVCGSGRQFIRYDERGNGLSDWDVDDISFEAFVRDLETVVDALGLEKFPLLGISQGCAVSVEYAARHPERVSGLILLAGYPSGWRITGSAEEQRCREAVMTLTKDGWGTANPAYRRIFSQTFMPDAKPELLEWFDEFQRQTTTAENSIRFQEAFGHIDVRDSLARVKAPTIVFHTIGDQRIPISQGRKLAAGIEGAEFVPLESNNHVILSHEPAWRICVEKSKAFLRKHDI